MIEQHRLVNFEGLVCHRVMEKGPRPINETVNGEQLHNKIAREIVVHSLKRIEGNGRESD